MAKFNRENIDRKTNKPNIPAPFGTGTDPILNRAEQTRRDDDVIRTPKRTPYDIDYAIKWYIENEIQPRIRENDRILDVPVIFANGEKWDNVRRLGFLRDEKGKLQSPLIVLKRNSIVERDNNRGLDVNRSVYGNHIIYRGPFNPRNVHEKDPFPIPPYNQASSETIYVLDIPKYVTIEYEILIWTDFTDQMNDLVDQILPYNRYSWGHDNNRYPVSLSTFTFETVNTVGEDRLVRCNNTLTVMGTLLSESETKVSTLKKMYSVKKVSFDQVIDVGVNLFDTTTVPVQLLQVQSRILSGTSVLAVGGGSSATINATTMLYLTELTEKQATRVNSTTVTVTGTPKINPVTLTTANVNEFDIFINGQYIDKVCYSWTPADTSSTQTIIFDTNTLNYTIDTGDIIIVKGRWA